MDNIEVMGVINITPNSFSDAGVCFNKNSFVEKWRSHLEQGCHILDVGAESTAPFNRPVTETEEKERFEKIFISCCGSLKWPSVISIDTYRPSVFLSVYQRVKKYSPQQKFIWNDVSGVLDEQLWETLKRCPDADYVCGHSGVKDRSMSSYHMDAMIEGDIIEGLVEHFFKASDEFKKRGFKKRVIFDPLFGFSKRLEQNWQLVRELESLMKRFSVEQRWLLGVSKKSFMQKKLPPGLETAERFFYTEHLHGLILAYWLSKLSKHFLILRVHDPILVHIVRLGPKLIY
jgi:dihydropteroate synthase